MNNVKVVKSSVEHDVEQSRAAAIARAISCIPEQSAGDVEDLIDTIMSVERPEDLDRPWRKDSARDLIGVTLRVDSVTRSPSTLDSKIGQYVVVRGVRLDTSETVAVTTSSAMIMVQLARAVQAGWLPIVARIVRAGDGRPGQSPPLRLEIVSTSDHADSSTAAG